MASKEKKKMSPEKKGILQFFFMMLLIFIVVDAGIQLLLVYLPTVVTYYKYGTDLIGEIFYALIALIVMLTFKNSYVFTSKQTKFSKSLIYGAPMIAFSVVNLIESAFQIKSFSAGTFLNILLYCIFIGITEEFLFRGWIQNEFIERFGDTKANVLRSILLASIIFGSVHIFNVFVTNQNLFETILQCLNAVACGFLLGIVYYKTKNIWSVIFLHAFYDFSIFLGEMNLIKDCTYATPSLSVGILEFTSIIILSVLWIMSALKVLNGIKERTSKKKDTIYTSIIVLTFILAFIPFERIVPEYDDYVICYDYNETEMLKNYEIHFPHYQEHFIDSTIKVSRFDDDVNSLHEIKSEENIKISFNKNWDGTIIIENELINYKNKLDIKEVKNIEILENDDYYLIIIESEENEATIYYSKINKCDLRNSKDFMDYLSNSFKKYDLPELSKIGYVTFLNNSLKHPYFVSSNNDAFIIINDSLYLIK